MEIILSERTQIALEHIPAPDQKLAIRFFELLCGFPNADALKGKVYKAPSHTQGAPLFVGKVGQVYRAIFLAEADCIRVVEIVHRDRLKRFLGWSEGGDDEAH